MEASGHILQVRCCYSSEAEAGSSENSDQLDYSYYHCDPSPNPTPPPPYVDYSRNKLSEERRKRGETIQQPFRDPRVTELQSANQIVSYLRNTSFCDFPSSPQPKPKLTRNQRSNHFPFAYSEQPTIRRSHGISIRDGVLEDMTAMTVYKVGFWIVSAILILIGAIIIGLLGAGRLSFREEEKVSSAEKLQRQVARFFILTFNDVTNETSDGSLVRTDHRYPEKMQHYVSHIESAVKSHPLPNLLRVDILNLQRENPSVIGVTALLAFDGGSTNESFSETDILDALNNSSITFGLKWVDLHVAEIKGLALPSPTQTGPVPTETKVPSTTDGSKAQPGPAPVVTSGGHCELGIVDYCENVVHHTRVYYPNILGHENPKEVEAALGLFQMLEHQQCHSTIKNFTCLLLQPPCSRGSNSEFKALPPCASYCYDVTSSCQNLLKGTYLEDAATTCNALPLSDCTQVCLPEHFVCKNSHLCLPSSSKCNGRYDCGPNDYSDEQGCGCTDPTKGQCPSGKCIDKSLFCNNQNDCGDWGDQVNCTCPAGYNRCTTTGQCFPERFWCNDEFECADKSDEKNCTCTAADFKCQNGYCLSPEVRCNGINDCDDFSDEFNCECGDHQYRCDKYLCKNYVDTWCNKRPECDDGTDEPANCTCKEYQFQCDNGQCIPIFQKCDGKPQCDDNSDELHCDCTKYEFKCTDGQCIPKEFVCDGKFQCNDGIDERQNCTCGKQKFPCDDGACMPVKWWCDGNKECKHGEDEPDNCEQKCPPDHPIKCVSWRNQRPVCVHKLQICDGHVMCKDGEDEIGCDCDRTNTFRCPGDYNGTVCLPWSKYCDGVQDCPHQSEETDCSCDKDYQITCSANGTNPKKCITLKQKCNGVADCVDGKDEVGCTCGEILANRQPERMCDGIPDCPDFTDEQNEVCKDCHFKTHFLCTDSTKCIPVGKVCDGIKDCPAGDDEKFCWKLIEHDDELNRYWESASHGYLFGRKNGVWEPACAANFTDTKLVEAVCDRLGYKGLIDFTKVHLGNWTSPDYISLSSGSDSNSVATSGLGIPTVVACPSNETIHIACDVNRIKCGHRPIVPDSATSRVVGGMPTKAGAWPSYAALYYKGELLCGAAIIDKQWVVTAAHCVFQKQDASDYDESASASAAAPLNRSIDTSEDEYFYPKSRQRRHAEQIAGVWEGYRLKNLERMMIRTGMIRNSTRAPFNQFRLVDDIIPHSMFNPKTGRNDLALLRLHDPLTYSAYVMPICMADRSIPLAGMSGQKRKCVAVGYGSMGRRSFQSMTDVLMEVELPVKDTAECQRIPTINVGSKIDRTQICAGTPDGGKDTCQGDSGGPLQCQVCNVLPNGESNCVWYLFGVTSIGYSCGSPMTPGVYTKISEFDDWILATMQTYKDSHHDHVCRREGKFTCLMANCIPEANVCDKNWDCSFGEDEDVCHNFLV